MEKELDDLKRSSAADAAAARDTKDYDNISLINARAILKSDKERPAPPEIDRAWGGYVFQLEQNWGTKPGDEPLSRLTQAYHMFWDAYGRYKK